MTTGDDDGDPNDTDGDGDAREVGDGPDPHETGLDPGTGAATFRAEFSDGRPPSEAVVEAIATAQGVEPVAVEPLYRSVDPEALDALFERPGRSGDPGVIETEFGVPGYRVVVRSDGTVTVFGDDSGG